MTDTTTTTYADASLLLDTRWGNPRIGFVAKHQGQLYRKDPNGWVPTHRRSDDKINRLHGATGLWKSDAATRIGIDLVIDAVEAARTEPPEIRADDEWGAEE